MTEEARLFGADQSLVGIVTNPAAGVRASPQPTAVLLLNSGLVHHVGPGRLYVRLARRLAALGHTVVRFDFSGIGDSPPRLDNRPFEQSCTLETRVVMDELARQRGIARFYLLGLCSGAVSAFRAAGTDDRVAGIAMLNARGFSADAGWRGHVESHEWLRDYRRKLLSPRAWWRALTGRSQYTRFVLVAVYRVVNSFKRPERFSAVARELGDELAALLERGVRVLLLNSEGDQSLDYLRELLGERLEPLVGGGRLQHEIIRDADHTFACRAHQDLVLDRVCDWLAVGARAAAPVAAPRHPQAAASAAPQEAPAAHDAVAAFND